MGNETSVPQPTHLPLLARQKVLNNKPCLEEISKKMQDGSIRKVVVMQGAGVSVGAGIPDFRSAGTGQWRREKKKARSMIQTKS